MAECEGLWFGMVVGRVPVVQDLHVLDGGVGEQCRVVRMTIYKVVREDMGNSLSGLDYKYVVKSGSQCILAFFFLFIKFIWVQY